MLQYLDKPHSRHYSLHLLLPHSSLLPCSPFLFPSLPLWPSCLLPPPLPQLENYHLFPSGFSLLV